MSAALTSLKSHPEYVINFVDSLLTTNGAHLVGLCGSFMPNILPSKFEFLGQTLSISHRIHHQLTTEFQRDRIFVT